MFTDMVGYSAISHDDEAQAISLLAIQARLLEPVLVIHHGRLIKSMGDGLFVEFSSAVSACRAAMEIQAAISAHNDQSPEREQFHIRIGIHIGDVEVVGDDLLGHGVNVAARIEPLADSGGICVSEDVQRQVGNKVSGVFKPMGAQSLKNIGDPIKVYILKPGTGATSAPSVDKKIKVPSLAVLPLVNLSPDPENEYFGDGLAEEILWALAKIQTLRVVSRTSCFALKGTSQSVREVGNILGVDHVLEGSVRRAGNRIRVAVQLVDIKTDRPLWSEKYDRDLEDIFAIQEEITESIVDALQIVISEAERGTIGKIPTRNLEAYTEYLKGISGTAHTPVDTISHFEKAVQLDPAFGRAFAELGSSCLTQYRYYDSENRELLTQARDSIKRALELDPDIVEAYIAHSEIVEQEGSLDEAEDALKKALEIDPQNYKAIYAYGRLNRVKGDHGASSAFFLRAAEVQPDDYQAQLLGSMQLFKEGEVDTALPLLEEGVRRAERYMNHSPTIPRPYYLSANALLVLGEKEKSAQLGKRAYKIDPEGTATLYNLACLNANLGDNEEAIKMLQEAFKFGFGYANWVRTDEDLTPIINDPRVQDLLAKMDARMASNE